MENNLILFSSVTLAMRGREVLEKNGIMCRLIRTPMSYSYRACGYSLVVNDNYARAIDVLGRYGIAYKGTAAADLG